MLLQKIKDLCNVVGWPGFRAVEALSVRIKDLDLELKPARVFVRGEIYEDKDKDKDREICFLDWGN